MEYRERYEEWMNNPYFDEATREELKKIADDDNEIKERFYKDLEFGTRRAKTTASTAISNSGPADCAALSAREQTA